MNDWLGDGDIFSEWVHDVAMVDVASGHAAQSEAQGRPAADDVDGRMARSNPLWKCVTSRAHPLVSGYPRPSSVSYVSREIG